MELEKVLRQYNKVSLKPDNTYKDNSLTIQLHFSQFENNTKGKGIKVFTPQILSS